MSWIRVFAAVLTLGVLHVGPARAEDDDDDEIGENTVTGSRGGQQQSAAAAADAEIIAWFNRPYDADSYRAAEVLGADVAVIDACREAVELVYARRYKDARKQLDGLTTKYPTSGIGPLGIALMYQALMFENFDFRYEKQYAMSAAAARKQLDAGLAAPGNDAFEHFLYGGLLGVEAIHQMRKNDFLGALGRATEALKHVEKTRSKAPTFADLALADGLYTYWRSVVTQNSKLLPDFPDRRAEGMALMQKAEKEAVFLGPGASLALAYSHIEERSLRNALDRCLYIRVTYPNNVINNMTLARIYTSGRRYGEAVRVLDEILQTVPDNQRAHYFRGVALARQGKYPDALKAYETYLGFKEVPNEYRGQTYYRLGALYVRQNQPDKALAYFKQSVATSDNQAAKRAIERLKAGK